MTLRFRAAESTLPVALISRLRKLTGLSIADLRGRAASGETLFEIIPFNSDWEDRRTVLVQVARQIREGSLPLVVSEVYEDGTESPVSPEMLHNLIQQYRGIELDTQRSVALESGEIDDPDDFEPDDEDWTA